MPKSFMNINHNMRLVVAAVFIGIMSVVFLGNSTQAFAQEPPTPTPLQGGITVTQPVTGSGPTSMPNTIVATATTESSDVVADESGSENVLEDDTNLTTDEPATTSQPESNPKSYTRFEVHQRAIGNLSGNLLVNGENFGQSVPYSASAGESFSVFSLFPERTGEYRLELTTLNQSSPILWIEGNLQKVGDGNYRHQFMNGDADPEFLTLDPDDPGMVIALGSVRARLNSCVQFYTPLESDFQLGVDTDGDNSIDDSELVSRSLENESAACIDTPESNLPLSSLYKSQVITPQGTVVAQNKGLYDFLNKSAIDAKKLARPDLIREFEVKWIRTPVATSVNVLNNALRPPPEQVTVVPQIEEITKDIIQNDADPTNSADIESRESSDLDRDEESVTGSSLDFVINNWLWIATGAGIILATVLIYQATKSTNSFNNRRSG